MEAQPVAAGGSRQKAQAITKEEARRLVRRGHPLSADNRQSGKASFKYFQNTLMASADPVGRSAMIRLQTQRTKLPTRSAAERRGPTNRALFVASAALIAQILSACSDLHQSVAGQYPDLNEPQPMAGVRADQVAQIKAELTQVRDNQERAAAQQQAFP